jgi:radical SAM superfamily enzyme YgiQ (UPF0313 family)
MELGKKSYDLAFPFLKRLNFGILAIASYMTNRGFEVGIFDPQAYPQEDSITRLLQDIKRYSPNVIGLSCISGFSYLSCKKIAATVRKHFPSIPIIVGGKDHVGQIAESVLLECPSIDIVVRGEGEEVLCQLLDNIYSGKQLDVVPNIVYRNTNGEICSSACDLTLNPQEITQLKYNIYPEFNTFAPSLEISRGCPFGCAFCVSAKTGVRKKNVSLIIDEAEYIAKMYDDNNIRIYLETPMFLMQNEELLQFSIMRKERGLNFTWRTETRVDYLTPDRLKNLVEAGCRVVDVGFESASPNILMRMGKTREPQKYLDRASEILRSASELGIILKFNVLFYIGETRETIGETISFFEDNLPYVTSLSAYPLLLYPGSSLETGIAEDVKQYGGSIINDLIWQERHLWPVNPSSDFTYEALQALGLLFTKSFQTIDTFYKQKRYGYFSPNTSYKEFKQRAEFFGIEHLPFSRNIAEAQENRRNLWDNLKNH